MAAWCTGAIEALSDGVVAVDGAGIAVGWNAAMDRLTGLRGAEVLGRPVGDILPLFREPAVSDAIAATLAGETESRDVACVLDARGSMRRLSLEISCVPWRDDRGGLAGAIVRIADVTRARRRAGFAAALEAIGRSLTASLDLDEILDTVADRTMEAMEAEAALVVAWDGSAPDFTILRAAGRLSREYVEAGSIPAGRGPVGRAVHEVRPIVARNILTDPHTQISEERRRQIEREGYRAVAAAPLVAKGRVHGALVVHEWVERDFTDDEVQALARLAEQAALAIDTARLYASAARGAERAARLGDLVSVTQSISASLDTVDVRQRIATAAAGLASGALVILHVYDAGRDVLAHVAVAGGEMNDVPPEVSPRIGLPGVVFTERRPLLCEHPVNDARAFAREWWQARPRATYYGVPILAGDACLGVLGFVLAARAPSVEEQEILQLLAAHAGVAIHNAGRYEAERLQAERIRALADVNRRVSGALELDELLQTIAESAVNLTGVRFASFWLADEAHRALTLRRGSDADIAADLAKPVLSYDEGLVGWTARHRTPLVIADVLSDARLVDAAWWRRWNLSSIAAYPVIAGDELLAILILADAHPIRLPAEARGMLELFLAQAAVAIRNARLYADSERDRREARALARAARRLVRSLDLDEVAKELVDALRELLGADASALYRVREDGAIVSVAFGGAARQHMPSGEVMRPGTVISRTVEERRPVWSRDVLNDTNVRFTHGFRAAVSASGNRAVLAVPLLVKDEVIGALAVSDRVPRDFVPREIALLQAFADLAALALQNARLYASARETLARLRDTQAQLVQAAKMSALGQLVSGVAHELNNPLSVVIGYGQLLLARDIPQALRRPIELMAGQGDRMAKIVRNLLFFARQRPPERAPVNLNDVLDQTLALRLSQLSLSGITVTKDFAADLPAIAGDAQQLQQVFLNLVLNAEQAITDSGHGRHIVLRTRHGTNASTVRAEISDDGPGISSDAMSRIFEPFFTTKAVGRGTGLGLSVSYGIVHEHGGRVTVDSQPGATTFAVELPVTHVPAPAAAAATPPPANGGGRRALVVEDEPSVTDLIVELLEETGWRVDVANGGRVGLELVRAHRYDVIVSDIRMADGGGEAFFRDTIAVDAGLARRFVFVTGDTANPDVWRFAQAEQVPIIEKPFKAATFLDVIRRLTTSLTPSTSSA